MQLPRLAETIELNNAYMLGIAVVASLLATWLLLILSSFLLRQAVRASHIKALETVTDGIYGKARLVATLLSLLIAVAGAAVFAYAFWRGVDLQPWANRTLAELTIDTAMVLGRSAGLVLLLLIAFYSLQRIGRRWVAKVEQRLAGQEITAEQREPLDKFLSHVPSAINLGIAYAMVALASTAFGLPAPVEWVITTTVYILLVINAGRTIVFLAYYMSERLLWRAEQRNQGTQLEDYYAALRRLLPVGQKSLEAIVYVSVATLIVRTFETLEPFAPYGPVIIRIISMFFAASVVVELSRILIARLLLSGLKGADDARRRRYTFVSFLQAIVKYVIYFCVSMMVLSDLGIDPTPILAGAGIVGITVGLGAQKIVQDLLNGFLILFDDSILHGDYVRIGETEGVVEQVSLRLTRIRDRYGRLHILRNGEIQNVINYSRGWTLTVVDMSVAYESDLKKALQVMSEVTAELPGLLPDVVIEKPQVVGIEAIDDSCLRVRIEAKVAPGCHYEVKRVLHRLLVDGFNANGLEIPYPKAVEIGYEVPASSSGPTA